MYPLLLSRLLLPTFSPLPSSSQLVSETVLPEERSSLLSSKTRGKQLSPPVTLSSLTCAQRQDNRELEVHVHAKVTCTCIYIHVYVYSVAHTYNMNMLRSRHVHVHVRTAIVTSILSTEHDMRPLKKHDDMYMTCSHHLITIYTCIIIQA